MKQTVDGTMKIDKQILLKAKQFDAFAELYFQLRRRARIYGQVIPGQPEIIAIARKNKLFKKLSDRTLKRLYRNSPKLESYFELAYSENLMEYLTDSFNPVPKREVGRSTVLRRQRKNRKMMDEALSKLPSRRIAIKNDSNIPSNWPTTDYRRLKNKQIKLQPLLREWGQEKRIFTREEFFNKITKPDTDKWILWKYYLGNEVKTIGTPVEAIIMKVACGKYRVIEPEKLNVVNAFLIYGFCRFDS